MDTYITPTVNGLAEPANLSPAAVYLASLASSSKRTMQHALRSIVLIATNDESDDIFSFPWHQLRFQHTMAIRAALDDRYAFTTVNKALCALRGTLRAAWQLELMDANDYHSASSVKAITGERLPAGRAIAKSEILAMLATCKEDTLLNGRDAAIIAVLFGCGLRRAEIVSLNLEDYQDGSLKILGKRNKQRLVPVSSTVAPFLKRWIVAAGRASNQPLFIGIGNKGKGRLTAEAVYAMLKKRAKIAGLANLSPHDFRRTFVSNLLDEVDITTVRDLAGHTSIETTARYDRRGDKRKAAAVELLTLS